MAIRTWVGNGDSANPNDWDNTVNWKESTVPVNGDDVYLRDSQISILDGLDQSAITLNSLNIDMTFTGLIGNDFTEFLEIASTSVVIGTNDTAKTPQGSRRLNLDLKSGTDAIEVLNTSSSSQDLDRAPLRLIIAEAGCKIYITKGVIGIGDEPDQTVTFDELNIADSEATYSVGRSVTYADLNHQDGTGDVYSMPTASLNVEGGTVNTYGTDALPVLTVGLTGTLNANHIGVTAAATLNGGLLNLLDSTIPRTYTALVQKRGSTLSYDPSIVTITTYTPEQDAKGINIALS